MNVACRDCSKTYDIPDERLPEGKREFSFPCPACSGIISVSINRSTTSPAAGSAKEQSGGSALKNRILRTLKDLPPMPQSVVKAREVMADPNSSFKDLAKLFETDQALATKVLKLANSAYYGLSGKVSSIQHASVLLGHQTLGDLITMTGASGLMASSLDGYGLASGDLWLHSLAVALGSRIISDKKHPGLADDAFMAGLIHDAGKLILDKHIFERKAAFDEFLDDDGRTFLAAEKEILGFDHSEIASEACKKWQIPDAITDAIRYHHTPSDSKHRELAYIVHVADLMAMMSGIGGGIDGIRYKMDKDALEFLGLEREELNLIMFDVMEGVREITGDM